MNRRRILTIAGATTAVTAVPSTAAAAQPAPSGRFPVEPGLDRLVATGYAALTGQRVGVISNPTGVDRRYRHLVDLIHADRRIRVVAVFGPEHGFRGSEQAGGGQGTSVDPRTGLTVYDAYNATPATWVGMYTRAGVETVVFDIQDV